MQPYLADPDVQLFNGDALEVLRSLPDRSVHMCATSPPFYGLRDYGTGTWEGGDEGCPHTVPLGRDGPPKGTAGGQAFRTGDNYTHQKVTGNVCKCGARRIDNQIGLEESPEQWVARLVEVFREVRRVLRDDGTLWVEIGDSYHHTAGGYNPTAPSNQEGFYDADERGNAGSRYEGRHERGLSQRQYRAIEGLKPKDLLGQPWLLAFALRADGWYLRSEIIWARPNPMPESVTDRPTKAHSTIFLLAKGQWKTRVVALADLHSKVVHVSNHVGSHDPNVWAHEFGVRLSTAILDSAEREQEFALPPLDSEVWQKFASGGGSEAVRDLPVEHRALMYASAFRHTHVSAKEFLCELDRLGIALTDGKHFKVVGGLTEFPLPPGVDRYGETAIAIHDSGEIGEVDFTAHTVKCSRPVRCSYFWDAEAIREPHQHDGRHVTHVEKAEGSIQHRNGERWPGTGANARSVWTIPTEPTPFAHFATWPQKLVQRMILAGTSERGVCPECGAPWVREVEVTRRYVVSEGGSHADGTYHVRYADDPHALGFDAKSRKDDDARGFNDLRWHNVTNTSGWRPSCAHDAPPIPATILDPFGGSGTTAIVARKLHRKAILIELNESYCVLAAERLAQQSLFATEGIA